MGKVTIDMSDFWSLDDKTAIYKMVEKLSTLVGFTAIKVANGLGNVSRGSRPLELCLDYKIVLNFGDNIPVDVPEMDLVVRFSLSGKVCIFGGKLTSDNRNLTYTNLPNHLTSALDERGLLFSPYVHREIILTKVGSVYELMAHGVEMVKQQIEEGSQE